MSLAKKPRTILRRDPGVTILPRPINHEAEKTQVICACDIDHDVPAGTMIKTAEREVNGVIRRGKLTLNSSHYGVRVGNTAVQDFLLVNDLTLLLNNLTLLINDLKNFRLRLKDLGCGDVPRSSNPLQLGLRFEVKRSTPATAGLTLCSTVGGQKFPISASLKSDKSILDLLTITYNFLYILCTIYLARP